MSCTLCALSLCCVALCAVVRSVLRSGPVRPGAVRSPAAYLPRARPVVRCVRVRTRTRAWIVVGVWVDVCGLGVREGEEWAGEHVGGRAF